MGFIFAIIFIIYVFVALNKADFFNYSYLLINKFNAYFKDLKPCLVCGSITSNCYHCLVYETPIGRKEFSKYYANKRDYVKAKQLNLFALLQKIVKKL